MTTFISRTSRSDTRSANRLVRQGPGRLKEHRGSIPEAGAHARDDRKRTLLELHHVRRRPVDPGDASITQRRASVFCTGLREGKVERDVFDVVGHPHASRWPGSLGRVAHAGAVLRPGSLGRSLRDPALQHRDSRGPDGGTTFDAVVGRGLHHVGDVGWWRLRQRHRRGDIRKRARLGTGSLGLCAQSRRRRACLRPPDASSPLHHHARPSGGQVWTEGRRGAGGPGPLGRDFLDGRRADRVGHDVHNGPRAELRRVHRHLRNGRSRIHVDGRAMERCLHRRGAARLLHGLSLAGDSIRRGGWRAHGPSTARRSAGSRSSRPGERGATRRGAISTGTGGTRRCCSSLAVFRGRCTSSGSCRRRASR